MYTYDDHAEQYWMHVLIPLWSYERPINERDNCKKLYFSNIETTNSYSFKLDVGGNSNTYKYYAVHKTQRDLNYKRDMPKLLQYITDSGRYVLWGNIANQSSIHATVKNVFAENGYIFAEVIMKCKDGEEAREVREECHNTLKELQEIYSNKSDEGKKGNNNMANLFGNIKVGKAGSKYTLTYFGTIAYNGKSYYNDKIYDATGMTINFDMLYLIPSTEVKKGDIIDRDGKAYYVKAVENGVVKAVDLEAGTEENIVPGGPFGMQLYSKIFNPMGNMQGDNAFGNMLMMQALVGNGNSDNGMLMAMMMMQGGFKFPTFEMPTPQAPTQETKK